MFSTKLNLILSSMRPFQWTKNGLIFVALVFSGQLTNVELLSKSILAFIVFSALSGSVYIINDIKDKSRDTKHPLKSKRPIASGRLNPKLAMTYAVVIALTSVTASFYLNENFGFIASVYLLTFTTYSFFLKHIPIVDLLVIAIGFVIRAVAGALVIGVSISSWLLLCTMLLALLIIIGKRRHEITLLGSDSSTHREVLTSYSTDLLDQMMSVVTASTLIAYCLYTVAEETVLKFGTENLKYSIIFVVYGIFRYLYIVYMKKEGGRPERDILTDVPTVINFTLWGLTIISIIYLK